MTTTDKLREALHGVEPGWQAPSVDGVRKRARRVRLRRRLACAVAATAVFATVVAVAPMVLRRGEPASSTASLSAGGPVPTSPAEALQVDRFSPRTGALPQVTDEGRRVTIPFVTGWSVQLMPQLAGYSGPGQLCVNGTSCRTLARSSDGWAVDRRRQGTVVDVATARAADFWVVDAPIGGAVASVQGRSVPVETLDLGFGYQLLAVELPAVRSRGNGLAAPDPNVWAFDLSGRLIARQVR